MNAFWVEECRHAMQIGVALLLQSGLLLALGLAAGWLLRRRGPELRAFVYQVTLAGVALGVVLSVTLAGHVQPVWAVRLGTPLGTPPSRSGSPPPRSGEDKSFAAQVPPISPALPALPVPSVSQAPSPPPVSGGVASLGEPGWVLVLLWPAVTGLLLLWLLACQWHLTRLRRDARPLTDGRAAEMLARLAAPLAVRPPLLLTSPHVRSPFLAGLRRPAIFLPSTWEADFDDATLRAVLAHELAHRTRRDCAWTLLLRLTTALLWPQPLLWLLARQLDQATEEACDLLALTPDCPPRRYADCLLRLADRALPGPAARTLGAGVVPVRSSLGRRIQALLDRRNHAMTTFSFRTRLGITFGAVVAATLATMLVSADPRPLVGVDSIAAAEKADDATSGVVKTHPFFGYGLGYSPPGTLLRLFRVTALSGSPAALAGIPTSHWSELVTVNGRSVKTSPKATVALLNSAPPLRLSFRNFGRSSRQRMPTITVILRNKVTLSVPSQSYETAQVKGQSDLWQTQIDAAEKSLTVYDQRFADDLKLALPNADAPTLAKARNVELWIGGYDLNIQSTKQDAKWSTRQNPTSQAEARRFIAGREALLAPYLRQEARLFLDDPQTQQYLAQIHDLAVKRQIRIFDITGLRLQVDFNKRVLNEVKAGRA